MKERPILFQGALVRALLAGTKTQTRRLIKPQPTRTLPNTKTVGDLDIVHALGWRWQKSKNWRAYAADGAGPDAFAKALADFSPYGVTGDRLYVKETWGLSTGNGHRVLYRADLETDRWPAEVEVTSEARWTPSIHMPRRHSRIALEVTEVRVERLHGISEEDAKAEGVAPLGDVGCPCEGPKDDPGPHLSACAWSHLDVDPDDEPHRAAFAVLWDAINGKRAPWASNPWLWCVSFKRLTP